MVTCLNTLILKNIYDKMFGHSFTFVILHQLDQNRGHWEYLVVELVKLPKYQPLKKNINNF